MSPRRRTFAFAASLCAAMVVGSVRGAPALPPPAVPHIIPSASPTPPPAGAVLPYGSQLLLVLDDKIDSGSTAPGTTIHVHLKEPLVVNGVTLAAAGAPDTLAVVTTRKAHSGDEDGAVQIHLDPLALPGRGASLPLRAYHEYLTIEYTAGQESTRSATDTVADIFIPGHFLYHALRPGRQMVLPRGSILRAETGATIDASDPNHLALSTPPPFVSRYDAPHADLTAPPIYTPAPERPKPLPKGRATLPPSAPPSAAASAGATTPSASPGPSGAPTAGPSPSAPAASASVPPYGRPSPAPSNSP